MSVLLTVGLRIRSAGALPCAAEFPDSRATLSVKIKRANTSVLFINNPPRDVGILFVVLGLYRFLSLIRGHPSVVIVRERRLLVFFSRILFDVLCYKLYGLFKLRIPTLSPGANPVRQAVLLEPADFLLVYAKSCQ